LAIGSALHAHRSITHRLELVWFACDTGLPLVGAVDVRHTARWFEVFMKYIRLASVIALVACLTLVGLRGAKAEDERLRKGISVGVKVPDFTVRTLANTSVTLRELQKDERQTKKGVVVLSFWCSTCHSCRHVEQQLAKLAKEYAGQAAVLALDANAGDTLERVAAFVTKKGLALPIVLDASGHAADLFGVSRTTTTVVIDGDGVLRYCGQFLHKSSGASAEAALQAVLSGKEVGAKTTPHLG
jgi:thiol-disulfide isomerase/thioredoxin